MRFITTTALCLALSGGVALADHPHRGYSSYGHRGWSAAPARSYYHSGYRYPRYNYGYNARYRYPAYRYNHVYPYRSAIGFSVGLTYPGYDYGYSYPAYGYGTYATGYPGAGSWVWD